MKRKHTVQCNRNKKLIISSRKDKIIFISREKVTAFPTQAKKNSTSDTMTSDDSYFLLNWEYFKLENVLKFTS